MPLVIKKADLPAGKVMKANVDGEDILVTKIGEYFYAIQLKCTHFGVPLSNGKLEGKILTCPGHGAKFDFETGKCISGPAGGTSKVPDLKTYKILTRIGDIVIEK